MIQQRNLVQTEARNKNLRKLNMVNESIDKRVSGQSKIYNNTYYNMGYRSKQNNLKYLQSSIPNNSQTYKVKKR